MKVLWSVLQNICLSHDNRLTFSLQKHTNDNVIITFLSILKFPFPYETNIESLCIIEYKIKEAIYISLSKSKSQCNTSSLNLLIDNKLATFLLQEQILFILRGRVYYKSDTLNKSLLPVLSLLNDKIVDCVMWQNR